MFTQPSGPRAPQWRTSRLPFLVHACTKRRYSSVSPLLSYALFCLFFKTCAENIFSSRILGIFHGESIKVIKKATCRSPPVAGDASYFPPIIFAKAKSVFPPVFARDRGRPGNQKGPTEPYAYEAARSPTHFKENLSQSAKPPHPGEANNDAGGEPPRNTTVLESAQPNGAAGGNTGDAVSENAQRAREEKAEKLQRIIDLFVNRNSDAEGTDGTYSAAEGDEGRSEDTHSGIFGNNVFIDRERQDELKAARMQSVIAALHQRSSGGLTSKDEKLDTVRPAEAAHEPESSSVQIGINREETVVQEEFRGSEGTSDALGVFSGNDQKIPQELTDKLIEKIRRGIQFTEKFDFDKAWNEALKTSKARLVWNITYTDEFSMARKLHEKMEAYVLKKYIALLKQERELQKIPIVGNPQLMHLLRNLLKREHIKTTKTDAEIGRLFRNVPRLFDWIPSVRDAEGENDDTTRQRYLVDEL